MQYQSMLPLVFDDSLSYYEVLCKLQEAINEMAQTLNELIEQVEELSYLPQLVSDLSGQVTELSNKVSDYDTFKENTNTAIGNLQIDNVAHTNAISQLQNEVLPVLEVSNESINNQYLNQTEATKYVEIINDMINNSRITPVVVNIKSTNPNLTISDNSDRSCILTTDTQWLNSLLLNNKVDIHFTGYLLTTYPQSNEYHIFEMDSVLTRLEYDIDTTTHNITLLTPNAISLTSVDIPINTSGGGGSSETIPVIDWVVADYHNITQTEYDDLTTILQRIYNEQKKYYIRLLCNFYDSPSPCGQMWLLQISDWEDFINMSVGNNYSNYLTGYTLSSRDSLNSMHNSQVYLAIDFTADPFYVNYMSIQFSSDTYATVNYMNYLIPQKVIEELQKTIRFNLLNPWVYDSSSGRTFNIDIDCDTVLDYPLNSDWYVTNAKVLFVDLDDNDKIYDLEIPVKYLITASYQNGEVTYNYSLSGNDLVDGHTYQEQIIITFTRINDTGNIT